MTTKTENFSVRETAKIDGGAYRWVEFPDGSARVEEWRGGKWVPGGADFDEFFFTPPVSPTFAARLGIPMSDLGPRKVDGAALSMIARAKAEAIARRRPHLVVDNTLH